MRNIYKIVFIVLFLVLNIGPIVGQEDTAKISLENTHWQLISLDGKNITEAQKEWQEGKEPFLKLMSDETQATGFSGCNQFTGKYSSDGKKLKFGPLATTRKMCVRHMDLEQNFLKALNNTAYFAIEQENLTLFSKDKKNLASFRFIQL